MSVRLVLAKGREKSLLRRHPWVFSGAVARMEGKASLGETIDIVDHQGKWLARGAYSPASQIRARVWTFDPSESIDIAFFSRRLQQAQKWRDWLAQKDGLDSYRLIAGESDGLPGITIDRFGNFLVLQLLSAGQNISARHMGAMVNDLLEFVRSRLGTSLPIEPRAGGVAACAAQCPAAGIDPGRPAFRRPARRRCRD